MASQETVGTLEFPCPECNDEAVIMVRVAAHKVGLATSLRRNGDVEVFMTIEDAEALAAFLQAAVQQIRSQVT